MCLINLLIMITPSRITMLHGQCIKNVVNIGLTLPTPINYSPSLFFLVHKLSKLSKITHYLEKHFSTLLDTLRNILASYPIVLEVVVCCLRCESTHISSIKNNRFCIEHNFLGNFIGVLNKRWRKELKHHSQLELSKNCCSYYILVNNLIDYFRLIHCSPLVTIESSNVHTDILQYGIQGSSLFSFLTFLLRERRVHAKTAKIYLTSKFMRSYGISVMRLTSPFIKFNLPFLLKIWVCCAALSHSILQCT